MNDQLHKLHLRLNTQNSIVYNRVMQSLKKKVILILISLLSKEKYNSYVFYFLAIIVKWGYQNILLEELFIISKPISLNKFNVNFKLISLPISLDNNKS